MSFPVKIDAIRIGDRLVADGGFTCLKDGDVLTVEHDAAEAIEQKSKESGFFVKCADGKHWLIGQVDDSDGIIVGFSRTPLE